MIAALPHLIIGQSGVCVLNTHYKDILTRSSMNGRRMRARTRTDLV
jgi:hypothetical protein